MNGFMEKIVIIGGGSFAGNLVNYIENMNKYEIVGYTDVHDNGSILDVPYIGDDSVLEEMYNSGVKNAAMAIGNHYCDSSLKQKVVHRLKEIGFCFPVIYGTNVIVHKGAVIGEGTILRDACIIQSNCEIGNFAMIGDKTVISHDTKIGDFSQVVTGCVLGRGITVGNSVFFGFSTVVTNDLTISDGCTIGACSLVNKDCLTKGLYFGQPATLKKVYE